MGYKPVLTSVPSSGNLAFLNDLEPIPEESPRFPIRLKERDIYGHLLCMPGEPVKILMPALGARFILDIVYALRMEKNRDLDVSASTLRIPASFLGIVPPPSSEAVMTIYENGLCSLEIKEKGGRWRREFWPDMSEVSRLGASVPSFLTEDWENTGHLELSIVWINGVLSDPEGQYLPIINLEDLETIAAGVIHWNGVDPVHDGRFGTRGYIAEGENIIKPRCLDIFMPKRAPEGLAFIYSLVDKPATDSCGSVAERAAQALPEDKRHLVYRALADIEISFRNFEPEKRSFHEESLISPKDALGILTSFGVTCRWVTGQLHAHWQGITLLGEDNYLSADLTGEAQEKSLIARLVENLALPFRQRPFPYRREVIFHAPLDVLRQFTPQTAAWENNFEQDTSPGPGVC